MLQTFMLYLKFVLSFTMTPRSFIYFYFYPVGSYISWFIVLNKMQTFMLPEAALSYFYFRNKLFTK